MMAGASGGGAGLSNPAAGIDARGGAEHLGEGGDGAGNTGTGERVSSSPGSGTSGTFGERTADPGAGATSAGGGTNGGPFDDETTDSTAEALPGVSDDEDSATNGTGTDDADTNAEETETLGNDATSGGSGDPDGDNPDDPGQGTNGCAVDQRAGAVVGYGAQTTGGGDQPPVFVSSFTEAEAALAAYRAAFKSGSQRALVIRYTGKFDFSTITDVCRQHTLDSRILQIKEMENVTFEGAPGSSGNFGIKINRAKNVIIRNMTLGLLPGGGDSDAITIEGNGTNGDVEHVWIDHNDLFSSTKDDCPGAGDTEFDGLIDIKKGARYITISYNHIHDHQKTGLIGHSDSDDMERYVTFHHNFYDNVVSRTPLHRFGYIHVFNNYYNRILSSGINVRMGGVALIESNYFENAVNPVTSRYSNEPGYWDLRDNYVVHDSITWTAGSDTLANAENWQSTAAFPSSELNYSYVPDEARCVKEIVMANAGATLSL